MKKIALLLIIFSFLYGNTNANYSDYIYKENDKYYTNYFYNGKFYKIIVPNNKEKLIELEHLYFQNKLDKSNIYFNTIKLNILLTKLGMEGLY